MKIIIASGKDGARKDEIEVVATATAGDLAKAYRPKMSEHRKSFRVPHPNPPAPREGKPASTRPAMLTLDTRKTLAEQGVAAGTVIAFKDLGPQIGYRTVFVIEYAGPIAFLLLYAMQPACIYGAADVAAAPAYSWAQKVLMGLFAGHFAKRELETFFVHKFSRPTMPLRNVFKNSIYYWTFGAFIGYVLCSPKYTAPSDSQVSVGAVAMTVFELLNFAVHVQLSTMRKGDGDQARNVPTGPLFALVSCPNYLFEVMSWVSFSLASNILSSWFFTFAGLAQMAEWAVKKHMGYIKVDPANKKKKAILPFIL